MVPAINGKKYRFELTSPEMNKTFLIETTTQSEVEDWINKIKQQSTNEISSPFAVQHNLHVDFGVRAIFVVIIMRIISLSTRDA